MVKKLSPNSLQISKKLFSLNTIADTYNHKGLKFLEKDDYENAITCFFQSLDYDQNYSHAYSNIGNALLKKGFKVNVFDNLSTGNIGNLPLDKINFYKIDLKKDYYTWPNVDASCIYHFAANADVRGG